VRQSHLQVPQPTPPQLPSATVARARIPFRCACGVGSARAPPKNNVRKGRQSNVKLKVHQSLFLMHLQPTAYAHATSSSDSVACAIPPSLRVCQLEFHLGRATRHQTKSKILILKFFFNASTAYSPRLRNLHRPPWRVRKSPFVAHVM